MQDFPERLTALEPFWGLWRLDAFIGKGSYGKVYRIKREEFGETYYAALKWISLPQNQSEIQSLRNEGYDDASIADHYASVIKAFQSEIVLMSKLRGHSHIVSFEDHLFEKRENELGWDILIRMELLESLPGFFKKDRAVRDVITLGCDICDALTLCAKYKIVHRDIKPDNIFVNENGDFKLGDFGVARQMEHTQTNMSRKGTPFFMAPEVYTGREADARADQYSLGLVMHRLLNAQQIPFAPAFDRILTHQEREEALLQRLRGEALPPPLQGSEKLKQIILKASNYQPKKRFAAPEEMKAALQQTLNERENQASLFKAASGQISSKRSSLRPEAAFKKGKKSKRDKKDKTGWVLGILVGLILLLTGTGIWLLLQTPDEDVPASFENTIPAVQTPVPSAARTPMPTATPVPIETLAAVLTSTPTIVPTFTPTPTATPTSAPTVTPTPAPTPAEESLASEYTYHFDGMRYSTNQVYKLLWRITVNPYEIAEEIPAIYQLIRGEDAAWLSPDYSYDWQLSAEAAEVFGSSVQKDYLNTVLKDHVYIVVTPEKEMAALGLIGKQVLTLTISRKSDDTVMTKVNCVLDSFACETRVIAFTPGKPVTITLPQDEIASTYDDAKVIYEWWRLPVDSVPINMTEWAGLTSYTFTPEADWDGDTVYTVVYREGMRGDGYTSTVCILKSDDTSSAQPAPTTQPEASDVPVSSEGNFEYRIDEAGNAVITKYTGSDTICRVPETLDGRTVVSIEGNRNKSVFEDCANLQNVLLPDTMQSIGQFAFSKCDSLVSVSLPESLISIGDSAFWRCKSLTSITIPDAVTYIGVSAFYECSSLQHVSLPQNLKRITWSPFSGCTALASIVCPDSVTYIGMDAFGGCTSLKNVKLPFDLETIGWAAFRNCNKLGSLALPEHVKSIEHEAFDGCTSLEYLYIPMSVEEIGTSDQGTLAFDTTTTLVCPENSYAEKYARENGLSYINGNYDTWKALVEKAEIHSSSPSPTATPTVTPTPAPTPAEELLASEHTYHFEGTRYNPESGRAWSISAFTGLIAQEIPAINQLIMENSPGGFLSPDYNYDWQLSTEAAAVSDSALFSEFEKDDRWYQMYIGPETAEDTMDDVLGLIGKTVFTLTISRKSDNAVMTKVNCVLDSFVYDIEWHNFKPMEQEIFFTPDNPVTITLPQDKIAYTHDGTTVIYDWLQSTDKVSYYELVSGADCTSVTFTPKASWDGTYIEPNVRKENEFGSSIPLGITYILKSDGSSPAQPKQATQPEESTVPVSSENNFEYRIDEAGNAVITKYTGSETICRVPATLDGRTVVSIEGNRSKSAFEDCVNLQYVLLPDTIQSIGQFAFSKCDSLTGVSLPELLTSIGFGAFKDCVSLQDLVFPDAVTFIGRSAFNNCSSLLDLALPESLETLSASAFAGCSALNRVSFPNSLTYIDHCVFDGCSSITNIILPTNLEKIGWAAFRNCSSLSSLVLPDSLLEVEYEAFDGCRKLNYLYIPASVEEIGVNEGISFAFDEATTLICPANSYAEEYAQQYDFLYVTGDQSTWDALMELMQDTGTSTNSQIPREYYIVLTSKRTYLYPRMDEESEAMLRIPGQIPISAVPAGDGWLKTEYAGIPGYVTTNNLKAYDLDKEYTWKEFQTMVNNALKACENGEVLVPGPKHVAAYKNGDKAITMPDGVKLIIEGGSFESMLVTNGKIELRNVTVNCAIAERCAITVSIPSKERSLELRIDENTTIAATGQYASAIGTDRNNTPSVKNAILNYRIVNNGRIESDGGSGIEIRNWSWGDNGEAQVYIENNGMILSRWWNGIRCNLCDQQELEIINRGSIESIGFGGIHIESGSFHITNESGAVIKGGFSSGAIWVVNSDADATISGSISNAGELQNLGVYTYVDFLPMIVYEGNDLEVSVRLTQIVRDKDEILTMEQTKEIAKELLRNIKNGSGYAFESAIIDLGTGERKFETEHEHTVYLESSEM